MITVQIDTDIDYPPGETFQFIANPENNPKWQNGMKRCVITSEGPWGLGSEYRQEAEFMGKPVITTFKITEYEQDHYIKGESIQSTFPITFKRIVESTDTGSKVMAIVTGAPTGILGWLPFLTRAMIKSSIKKDYQQLKKLLESKN